ncbi:MAG: ferritin-like domain-containing protein [Chryseobacterium sp.]
MENLQVLTNEVKMATKEELYALLVSDLRNELTHLHFYLQSAALVQGLHSKEYKEHFLEESSKELKHVSQFSDLLIGLGLEITNMPYYEKLPKLNNPVDILKQALTLEEEVVSNYTTRMHQAESLKTVDGDWIHIFLEKQIEESRLDVDELKQIIRGINSGF